MASPSLRLTDSSSCWDVAKLEQEKRPQKMERGLLVQRAVRCSQGNRARLCTNVKQAKMVGTAESDHRYMARWQQDGEMTMDLSRCSRRWREQVRE